MRISDWSSDVCSSDLAKTLVMLMEQFNILFDGIAEPVQPHIVGPPIFVGEAIEKTLVVRGPDQGRQCAWNDIGQHRARLKIAHPRLASLGTVERGRETGRGRVCQYV